MSRTIMIIPVDNDVSLNSTILGIIYFFNRKIFNNKQKKSILYFSCANKLQDNTSLIISKYFSRSVEILNDTDFSKTIFHSTEYFSLLNKVIETIYYEKFSYKLILIKGLNYNLNIYSQEINYNIAQNLSAEVIFLANVKSNTLEGLREKEIKLIIERYNINNVLGIIFNKINSPFIDTKYDFFTKLKMLKNIKEDKTKIADDSTENYTKNLVPIIARIPWTKSIKKIYVIDIYTFLNIQCLNLFNTEKYFIEEIIIFDESIENIIKRKYFNVLFIVSFSRLKTFLKFLTLNSNEKENNSVIITAVEKSEKDVIISCNILIQSNIFIAFTKNNTITILSQLQNFNFNIYLKNKHNIVKIQKYIAHFFSYSSLIFSNQKYNYHLSYSPQAFCCYLKILSRKNKKRIILPESYETRILKAASICQKENIAQCILLGNRKKINDIANQYGIQLHQNIEIIDPTLIRDKYISRFVELRKKKGATIQLAKSILQDNVVLATLMLEANQVDGLVSGSVNTTANTILPALQLIKTNSHSSLVSSIFFMLLPNKVVIYADCAVNIDPKAEELAEIAIQSSHSLSMFGIEPRIAMLSYSTDMSGYGEKVELVRQATKILHNKRPDLIVDGPIQYDAAVSKTVFQLKCPHSPIKGNANIFIFPDLNAGNIAYKAVQRSAKIISIGPILQGLNKPVNDLSRGASIEDIIYTIALTSMQSV